MAHIMCAVRGSVSPMSMSSHPSFPPHFHVQGDTKAARAEYELVYAKVMRMGYKVVLSLGDIKRSGTLVMVKEALQGAVRAARFNLAPGEEHEAEGRVILLEFADLDVLATYCPNHGYSDSHFERCVCCNTPVRRKTHSRHTHTNLPTHTHTNPHTQPTHTQAPALGRADAGLPPGAGGRGPPAGVAGRPERLAPPARRLPRELLREPGTVYKMGSSPFTIHNQPTNRAPPPALIATNHLHTHTPQKGPDFRQHPDPDYWGQPGYTPIERRRFAQLLAAGGLVDAYRALHPNKSEGDWTWRGSGPEHARYWAKGAWGFGGVWCACVCRKAPSVVVVARPSLTITTHARKPNRDADRLHAALRGLAAAAAQPPDQARGHLGSGRAPGGFLWLRPLPHPPRAGARRPGPAGPAACRCRR